MENLNANNEGENNLYDDKEEVLVSEESTRYHMLLARGRARARATFSEDELWLMLDVVRETILSPDGIDSSLCWMADLGCIEWPERGWKVDSVEFMRKLREAEASTLFALVDVVEQFWLGGGDRTVLEVFDDLDDDKPRFNTYLSIDRASNQHELFVR